MSDSKTNSKRFADSVSRGRRGRPWRFGDRSAVGSRRRFLAVGAATAAAPMVIPASALGLNGQVAANDRIVVGAIGCGVRGISAIGIALDVAECQVAAVCDVRAPRLEHAQDRCNNHYAAKHAKGSYRDCQAYHEYRELLAREDIDVVLLTPPDHWHGVIYSDAIRAGKDVYGEKPITRTIAEGQALRRLIRQYGTVFQTGTHSRSMARVRHACQLVRNGYLGTIHTIEVSVVSGREYPSIAPCDPPKGFDYDRWTGPAPYVPFDKQRCEWLAMYMISHYCAGFITNWGVHFLDIAQWGCPEITSKPFTIEGRGEFPQAGMTDTCCRWDVTLSYESGLKVRFTDHSQQPNGCRFVGDKGWVRVNWGKPGFEASDPALRNVQFSAGDVRLHASPGEAMIGHTLDLLHCVRTRQEPVAPFEQGHRATTIGNVADIAVRLRRTLRWDWETESFDDTQANAMRSRPMREPYTI